MNLAVPADDRVKIKGGKKLNKYFGLSRELEHESDGDTSRSWKTWNGPQRPGKETRRSKEESRPPKLHYF